MASIKCKSCGRRYSYLESNLCPHCGAYNKPVSRMRVDFDKDGNAELLNEKQFLRQSAANRQQKDCYEHETAHESGKATVRHGGGVTAGKLIAVAAVLVAVFIAVCGLNFFIGLRTSGGGLSPDIEIVPEAPAEEITSGPIFYYDLGEQFVIDGQPVRVETVGFDTEEFQATVYWENEAIYTPELYVFYEDGRELLAYTWYEDNAGDGNWQYGYTDDGFGWDGVAEAYLTFTNYADDPYYEVRVDITEVFQDML